MDMHAALLVRVTCSEVEVAGHLVHLHAMAQSAMAELVADTALGPTAYITVCLHPA